MCSPLYHTVYSAKQCSFVLFPPKQDAQPKASLSLMFEEYVGEKGEESSSQQQLSVENQARLRDIALLLNKDVTVLVQEADQIRDIIDLIDQEIPPALKASLDSAACIDDYFGPVKRANKNIATRASLKNDSLTTEQQAKELHSQIQSSNQTLATLEPKLRAMKEEKARLEAQLAELNANIQLHEEQLADLPNSIETAKAKISSVIQTNRQIKTKLSKIQSSEDDDQKVLRDVSQIRNDVIDVINSFLNE